MGQHSQPFFSHLCVPVPTFLSTFYFFFLPLHQSFFLSTFALPSSASCNAMTLFWTTSMTSDEMLLFKYQRNKKRRADSSSLFSLPLSLIPVPHYNVYHTLWNKYCLLLSWYRSPVNAVATWKEDKTLCDTALRYFCNIAGHERLDYLWNEKTVVQVHSVPLLSSRATTSLSFSTITMEWLDLPEPPTWLQIPSVGEEENRDGIVPLPLQNKYRRRSYPLQSSLRYVQHFVLRQPIITKGHILQFIMPSASSSSFLSLFHIFFTLSHHPSLFLFL